MLGDEHHAGLENLLKGITFTSKMGWGKIFFMSGFVKHAGEESISLLSGMSFLPDFFLAT